MNKAKRYDFTDDQGAIIHSQIWIDCPGCGITHGLCIFNTSPGPLWGWNGSLESPTFTPSLLCNGDYPESRCHSFITDGKIQFLSDCYHSLAGQTVELPEYDQQVP